MQIYSIGPDELSDYEYNQVDQENYDWLVYWYENYGYEGSGEAVALRKDGLLQVKALGHCSCYGPMDEWSGSDTITVEEFFRKKDSIHDDDYSKLEGKVKELMGLNEPSGSSDVIDLFA